MLTIIIIKKKKKFTYVLYHTYIYIYTAILKRETKMKQNKC